MKAGSGGSAGLEVSSLMNNGSFQLSLDCLCEKHTFWCINFSGNDVFYFELCGQMFTFSFDLASNWIFSHAPFLPSRTVENYTNIPHSPHHSHCLPDLRPVPKAFHPSITDSHVQLPIYKTTPSPAVPLSHPQEAKRPVISAATRGRYCRAKRYMRSWRS